MIVDDRTTSLMNRSPMEVLNLSSMINLYVQYLILFSMLQIKERGTMQKFEYLKAQGRGGVLWPQSTPKTQYYIYFVIKL